MKRIGGVSVKFKWGFSETRCVPFPRDWFGPAIFSSVNFSFHLQSFPAGRVFSLFATGVRARVGRGSAEGHGATRRGGGRVSILWRVTFSWAVVRDCFFVGFSGRLSSVLSWGFGGRFSSS